MFQNLINKRNEGAIWQKFQQWANLFPLKVGLHDSVNGF